MAATDEIKAAATHRFGTRVFRQAARGPFVALLLTVLLAASPGGKAKGQTLELSAGWTIPTGELADVSDGGLSVRGSFLYPLSWGYVMAWSGYTDHRGQTFELPPGAIGIAAGKIDAQDVPFLAGVRLKPGKAHIDLTAGGLWRRLKLGALDAAGTSIDPAAAVHAGLTIHGGLKIYGGLVIARNDWRYMTAGLGWQF